MAVSESGGGIFISQVVGVEWSTDCNKTSNKTP